MGFNRFWIFLNCWLHCGDNNDVVDNDADANGIDTDDADDTDDTDDTDGGDGADNNGNGNDVVDGNKDADETEQEQPLETFSLTCFWLHFSSSCDVLLLTVLSFISYWSHFSSKSRSSNDALNATGDGKKLVQFMYVCFCAVSVYLCVVFVCCVLCTI